MKTAAAAGEFYDCQRRARAEQTFQKLIVGYASYKG
jgi:hypothetical protein